MQTLDIIATLNDMFSYEEYVKKCEPQGIAVVGKKTFYQFAGLVYGSKLEGGINPEDVSDYVFVPIRSAPAREPIPCPSCGGGRVL